MEPFNFGRTFSRIFALMRDSIATVGVFVLAIQLVNVVISFVAQQQMFASMTSAAATAQPDTAVLAVFSSPWYWLTLVFSLGIGSMSWAGSLDGMIRIARGEQTSVGACFQAGIAKFLPVLGLTILWGLGVGLGWILLIVPGIILMMMWSVALPALIGENLGIIESFGRSRELTKGSRLVIFGLLLVALIIVYLPMLLLGGVIGGGMMSGMIGGIMKGTGPDAIFYLLTIPYGWFVAMFLNSLLVSIYTETTLIKGGGSTTQLTNVFG
jgi:hypothetical protein